MNQLTFFNTPASLDYLPHRDHPARRVAETPSACNTIELLATLIGGARQVEIANDLLAHYRTLTAIRQASASEIALTIHGIGSKTAARLISALELGARLATETADERPAIHSPADIAALVQQDMAHLEQEELWVLLLDTRNRLIGIDKLYRGSVNSSQIRVGEIFKAAIRCNATSIAVVHNHPSSDPSPSPDDVAVTRAICEAGKLVDITCLDHLVIGREKFVSLKERGLGGL